MRACPDVRIVNWFQVGITPTPDWFTENTINKFAKFVPEKDKFFQEEVLSKGQIITGKYYISTVFGLQEVPYGSVIIQHQQETFLSFCSYEYFQDKYTKLE